MDELFLGIIIMIGLYGLGRVLYPDIPQHKVIQQEIIKMGDEKDE